MPQTSKSFRAIEGTGMAPVASVLVVLSTTAFDGLEAVRTCSFISALQTRAANCVNRASQSLDTRRRAMASPADRGHVEIHLVHDVGVAQARVRVGKRERAAGAMVSGPTPSSAPPSANAQYKRAMERAVPTPLPAGTSTSR